MTGEALSVNMKTTVSLLELFVVAIALAFAVTFTTGTVQMQILSVAIVIPIVILALVLIRYCRQRKAWSYAGSMALGVLGVTVRVVVSSQPSLEVGGGLPIGVTVVYVVLGSLVVLKSYESFLELRKSSQGRA